MKPKLHIPDITDSGRRAYRLQLEADAPLRVRIDGQPVQVDNLSATGIAFSTESMLTKQYYPARLKFRIDRQVHSIDCTLRLIRKNASNWCADFSGLSPRDQRLLSEFITWYQAEQIRNRNKNS